MASVTRSKNRTPGETDLLYRSLRRLVEAHDLHSLHRQLLEIFCDLTGCEHGFSAIVDRERELLEPMVSRGRAEPGPFSLEWPPAAQAASRGRVRILDVALGEESIIPDVPRLLVVPIASRGRLPAGVVCVASSDPRGLDAVESSLLEEIADATTHLFRRRVAQAQREEELSLLWDVQRKMSDPDLDLDEANLSALLAKILRIALRRTRTQNGGIFLVDEDTGDLAVEQQAVRGDLLGRLPERLKRTEREGSGIIFWAIEHNLPYHTGDVSSDPLYLPFFRSIRSNLTVPISFQDRAIGAIAVESVETDFFRDEDIEVLRDLAREATMFIRRAQLYRQTRSEGRRGILIKGVSDEWVEVERRVERAAGTDAMVLIRGESGTGKELQAHSIHFNSRRAKKPFIVVNAGAIPETLLESELFGHVQGAFTGATRDKAGQFELADGGTIFLDEIGDLSPALQVKLLRTLQSGEIHKVGSTDVFRRVDVRVIAATNRDLEGMVRTGDFREDLYFRLNVVPIWLPPLRRYLESLPGMARAFIRELARKHRRPVEGVSKEALDILMAHDWPGNVRELHNCIEQAVILEEGSLITPEALPADVCRGTKSTTSAPEPEPAIEGSYHSARAECLRRFELAYLKRLLREADGNVSKAARRAGISRVNLHRLLRKHELRKQDQDSA